MKTQTVSGLEVVQDAEQMRAVFQRHLQPADGASLEVQSCQIDYVRQSASRLVLKYTLQLRDSATGEVAEQVVTGTSYPAERMEKLVRRLGADNATSAIGLGPFALAPMAYVSELQLLIQVFPHDFRLPGMLHLFRGTPELMQPLLAQMGEGEWRIDRVDAHAVRYRPDMRAMVRVDVEARNEATGVMGRQRAYAKVYREDDEGRQAQRILQTLWEGTAGQDAGFHVARPIAFVDRWKTLFLSEVPGERMLSIVRRADADEVSLALPRAARAVAAFHQFPFPSGMLPAAERDQQERLAEVAGKLNAINPDRAGQVEEIVATIRAALDDAPPAPTHFDLKLGHMVLDDQRLTLLDFDKIALGDPLIDIANLVATLGSERERSEQRAQRRIAMVDVFTEEYFKHVPTSWQARFPARLALAALAEAATTGRGLRGRGGNADHAARVESALHHAERVLNGQSW